MSDGISEAYGGTYFRDRSKSHLTERERLERELRMVEAELQDLLFERDNLKEKLKNLK